MRTLLVFTALLFLLPPLVEAYHVGEKPRPAPPSDAGKPQILRVSQTELEFGSAVAGPVACGLAMCAAIFYQTTDGTLPRPSQLTAKGGSC